MQPHRPTIAASWATHVTYEYGWTLFDVPQRRHFQSHSRSKKIIILSAESDLIDFIHLALEKQNVAFELLNLGLGKSVSVRDLVHKMIQFSGMDLKAEFDLTKPSIGFKLDLNIDKAKSRYGWTPNTSLDGGIQKTLRWYRENLLGESIPT